MTDEIKQELKKEKAEAESRIIEVLSAFTGRTGLIVTGISFDRHEATDHSGELICAAYTGVELDTKI